MKKFKELNEKEMQKIKGGGNYTNGLYNGNGVASTLPYYGGTEFTHQGFCPSNSKLVGYIGGGVNVCKSN